MHEAGGSMAGKVLPAPVHELPKPILRMRQYSVSVCMSAKRLGLPPAFLFKEEATRVSRVPSPTADAILERKLPHPAYQWDTRSVPETRMLSR